MPKGDSLIAERKGRLGAEQHTYENPPPYRKVMYVLDLDSNTRGLVLLTLVLVPEVRLSTAIRLIPFLCGGHVHSWREKQGR